MAKMVTALFIISVVAILDRCHATGYVWRPFRQSTTAGPPPPPPSPSPSPSPPPPPPPEQKPEKPVCVVEGGKSEGGGAEEKKKDEAKKETEEKKVGGEVEGGPSASQPVGFPARPFSDFPPSQNIPVPPAFYQGLNGGPLAGFPISPGKGAVPVAVLADYGPAGPPVLPPSPNSYPVLGKGGSLKGWRAAPLSRPIVLQQVAVPSPQGYSKFQSVQAVSPKGALVFQASPNVWNVSPKGGLSYVAF